MECILVDEALDMFVEPWFVPPSYAIQLLLVFYLLWAQFNKNYSKISTIYVVRRLLQLQVSLAQDVDEIER